MAALEELCARMNEDISSMQTVISALEESMYITDVRDVADGYVIEFSNGETITIRHERMVRTALTERTETRSSAVWR